MIAISLAVSFLGVLSFAGWALWLREKRPRPLHEGVELAKQLATEAKTEAIRVRTEFDRRMTDAVDTLSAKHTKAKQELEEVAKGAVEKCRAEADEVRGDMNALAAAVQLTRAGKPFTARQDTAPAAPRVAEVLR